MPGRLEGKIVIITGGGSGFGAGITKKLTSEGAKVLVWDINKDFAERTVKSCSSGTAVAFEGDVSDYKSWEAALKACLDKFGALDVVVNNAGVVHTARPSIEVPESELDRMMRINVKPIYHSAKAIIPYWKENKRPGLFINLSSISAPRPRPNLVWYAASKGAVTAATRGLAAEYAKDNIRYNCLQPVLGETGMVASVLGGVDTPEGRKVPIAGIPMGRISTPEDIANSACFLASDEASFLTGVCLDADGGRSLM